MEPLTLHKRLQRTSSGRPDLNRGPHRPERCALPGCATPRERRIVAEGGPRRRGAGGRGGRGEGRPARCRGPLLWWTEAFERKMARRLGLMLVAIAALLALPASAGAYLP